MAYLIDNVKKFGSPTVEDEPRPIVSKPFGSVLPDNTTTTRPYSYKADKSISINRNNSFKGSENKTLTDLTVSNNLRAFLGKRESNNNYKATNSKSSAAGKYQFLWNLWGKDIAKVTGIKSKEAFLNSPEAQEKFYSWHENTNIKPHIAELRKHDVHGLTDNQLGAMIHFRGLGNAKQVVAQDLTTLKEKYNMTPQQYIKGLKAMGGETYSAIGQGLGFLGQGIDSLNTSTSTDLKVPKFSNAFGSAGKGLGLGATIGSVIPGVGTAVGAAVGGVIGLGAGLLKNRQQTREYNTEKRKRDGDLANLNDQYMSVLQNNKLAGYPIQGTKGVYGYYAYGGRLKKYAGGGNPKQPEYEVEQDEVVQGQGVELEDGTQVASDMHVVGGEKHENGGTQGAGGERVFSDRLMINPILHQQLKAQGFTVDVNATYAQIATLLGQKKGKYEIKINTANPYAVNTGSIMMDRINQLIELTYQMQELEKGANQVPASARMYAYGGRLPKMALGGNPPKKKVQLVASGDKDKGNATTFSEGNVYRIDDKYYIYSGGKFESTNSTPKNTPNSVNNPGIVNDVLTLNDVKSKTVKNATYNESVVYDRKMNAKADSTNKANYIAETKRREAAIKADAGKPKPAPTKSSNTYDLRANLKYGDSYVYNKKNYVYDGRYLRNTTNGQTEKLKPETLKSSDVTNGYYDGSTGKVLTKKSNNLMNGLKQSDNIVDKAVVGVVDGYKSIRDGITKMNKDFNNWLVGDSKKGKPSSIAVHKDPPSLPIGKLNNSAKIDLPMPKKVDTKTEKKKVTVTAPPVVTPTQTVVPPNKNLTVNPQVIARRDNVTVGNRLPANITVADLVAPIKTPSTAVQGAVNRENKRFADRLKGFGDTKAGDLLGRFGVSTALNVGNYLVNKNQISKLETNYNPTLNNAPAYNYTDRSFATKVQVDNAARNAYNALEGIGTQNRNSYRGAIFSSYLNAINQANANENQRLDAYNENYTNNAQQVQMSNVGLMNDANYRSLEARNAKRTMQLENTNNLFSNTQAAIKEDADIQTQKRQLSFLRDYYNNRGGLGSRVLGND